MAKKSKNYGVISLILITYIGSVLGSFYLGQASSPQNSSPKTIIAGKKEYEATWRSFQNEEYGFTFEYPAEVAPWFDKKWVRSGSNLKPESSVAIGLPTLSLINMFSVEVYKSTLDAGSWWNEVGKPEYKDLKQTEIGEATVGIAESVDTKPNGISIKGVSVLPEDNAWGPIEYKRSIYVIKHNDYIYVIEDNTNQFLMNEQESRIRRIYHDISGTLVFN